MKVLITGGAGFIGSHIADSLLEKDIHVVVLDNLSGGRMENIEHNLKNPKFSFIEGDIFDERKLTLAMKGVASVYHFAAYADVRGGIKETDKDIKQGLLSTYAVLEGMRKNNVKKVVFPSSMTVYGVGLDKPYSESFGPCLPISLYAAAKLGAEGLISAYASLFRMQAFIFRFANVIGPRLTHGIIYDLTNKLLKNKNTLEVLGNGKQAKPYIYVSDLIHAMSFVERKSKEDISLYNVGVDDSIAVSNIVAMLLKKMQLETAKVVYGKTAYGWKGDVIKCEINISRLKHLGFTPQYSSHQAVEKTIDAILTELRYGK